LRQRVTCKAFRLGAAPYVNALNAGHILHWMCTRVESQDPDLVSEYFGVQVQLRNSGLRALSTKAELVAAAIKWLDDWGKSVIVSIKVRGQDGTEVFFKLRYRTRFRKLMDVYAQRQGGTPEAYRFIFDGNRIVETATPEDIDNYGRR
jgi:small ubiquitin-related modifier